ncbi:MAG: hypothetical protein U9N31_10775 [Candidatus Marinimicrobia bacterium]|nr:hypothetical protein [Candidatus Neomarinimicrobiota bacterium]
MKKLSLLLIIALFATMGCEGLNKDEIVHLDDEELQAFSDGLNADVGLSSGSINALNAALNKHGKDGKHRRDPGFLWKVAAEMQGKLSDEEKARLFKWMDENSVPYLFGGGMDAKGRGGPKGDKGDMGIRMIFEVLDDDQKEALKKILESYGKQMRDVMEEVKAGTKDKDTARIELEALNEAMKADIDDLLTDEQKQKLEEMKAEMDQKMAEGKKAAHDAMVDALEMTTEQESGLESINKETADAVKAFLTKAKDEQMDRKEVHEGLKSIMGERNDKIEALFNDKQTEIIKIYTALGMQYARHCGQKGRDGKQGDGKKG